MSGPDDQDAERAARVYLAVPFAERGEARRLGARWDGAAKRWYARRFAAVAVHALERRKCVGRSDRRVRRCLE